MHDTASKFYMKLPDKFMHITIICFAWDLGPNFFYCISTEC